MVIVVHRTHNLSEGRLYIKSRMVSSESNWVQLIKTEISCFDWPVQITGAMTH